MNEASGSEERGISPHGLLLVAGGVVVVVQAVVLTLAFQVVPHTGGDNAAYLTLAHSLLERGAYLELWEPGDPPHAKYPPVFPALLAAVMGLGAATWTAFKGVSALFVSLAVILAFAWAGARRGALFALAVALLLVLSDAFLDASHWVLSEPPFLALTLAALWAADRVGTLRGIGEWWGEREGEPGLRSPEGPGSDPYLPGWIALVGATAVLAYFTRSAGLPLVAAVALWLGLARRWRTLAAFGAAFALPALLWVLRARGVGEEDYIAEFWLVDPYQRELGTVGPLDLGARVLENLRIYVLDAFPVGVVGPMEGWAPLLGVALVGLAAVGWGRRLWSGPGLAELFAPIYLGLILLWPEVWSGDRFALPLYPLLLFYAGESVVDGARRLGSGWPPLAGAAAFLALALPALGSLADRVDRSQACREVAEEMGPYACQPAGAQQFNRAAAWSGTHLPDDAVVYSRKPRIFHLLSGLSSRMYPQTRDPAELLEDADATGVGYVVLDQVDAMSMRYLGPAVESRLSAFCHLEAWQEPPGPRTFMLGIRPPVEDGEGASGPREGEGPGEGLEPCAADRVRADPAEPPELTSPVIPIVQP